MDYNYNKGGDDEDQILIRRPVYSNVKFEDKFNQQDLTVGFKDAVRQKWQDWSFKESLLGFFPFIRIMRAYNIKTDLVRDLGGGLTVGIMNIPQGMAYAMLASVKPVFGLYVTFYPGLIYFFLGTSKHLAVGIFAVVSLMIGSVVDRETANFQAKPPAPGLNDNLTGNSTCDWANNRDCWTEDMNTQLNTEKMKIAIALTFLVGILQIALGMFRLGVVAVYLSQPVIKGFTSGSAIHVFTSQLSHGFGLSLKRYSGPWKLIYTYRDLFSNIKDTNWAAFITTILCLLVLIAVKEGINNNPRFKKYIKVPLPVELFVVVIATLASHFGKLGEKYNLKVVGEIPSGIPTPAPPEFNRIPSVIGDSVAVAIVAFATSVSLGKLFAKKHGYEIDPNQELYALGIANVVSCFFNSFASSGALARSLVQESVGTKTQLASVFSCILVLLVILFIGPLFENLPNAALAAIILVALKRMFLQFTDLYYLWPISRIDFFVWLLTFLAVALLDVTLGLAAGLAVSIISLIIRTQGTPVQEIGNIPGTEIYMDKNLSTALEEIQGIKMIKFADSVHYANIEAFKSVTTIISNEVNGIRLVGGVKEKVEPKKLHTVILDCTSMTFMDTVGITALTQLKPDMEELDCTLLLAGCSDDIMHLLKIGGFTKKHGKECFYVTVHDAVVSTIEEGVDASKSPLDSFKKELTDGVAVEDDRYESTTSL